MANLIVLLLLISPVLIPVPKQVPAPFWVALKSLAEHLELWPTTGTWNEKDFAQEVRWTWTKCRELRDCPRLDDADFLPSAEWAHGMLGFYAERQRFLEGSLPIQLHHAEDLRDMLEENDRALRGWYLIKVAQGKDWPTRRLALAHLRAMGWGSP